MQSPIDTIILGAGPAGLQLASLLQKKGRGYLVLERAEGAGAFFRTFPRHRTLISINKPVTGTTDPELNLRMDWNSLLSEDPSALFTRYSERYFPDADDMVRYLEDFARSQRLRIRYRTEIVRIRRDRHFELEDAEGRVHACRRLVVATGLHRPNVPDIEGIELAQPYTTMSIDPQRYSGQRVLILGKGNSAFETADHLLETAATIHVAGPRSIKMAWRTHYVGHLRAVNNNFLDTYQLKSQNALLDASVKKIEKRGDKFVVTASFVRADEMHKDIEYDAVLNCTGFRFDDGLFEGEARPELTLGGRFPDQTEEWESANVPDLYFAGTLMQVRDFKKSTSGFIHGFRYCVRALFRILERKYYGQGWPSRALPATPDAITDAIIARVNRTSCLWQQFGFLADLVELTPPEARYFEELPVDYIHARSSDAARDYLVITLDYGPDHDKVDPFDVNEGRITQSEVRSAGDSQYLHPIVRLYRSGELVREHHVTENLENEWNGPVHVEPLRKFLAEVLGVSKAASVLAGDRS